MGKQKQKQQCIQLIQQFGNCIVIIFIWCVCVWVSLDLRNSYLLRTRVYGSQWHSVYGNHIILFIIFSEIGLTFKWIL